LLPVLLITVIATALGGLFARDLYDPAPPSVPAAVQPPPTDVPLHEQPGSPEVGGTTEAAAHPLYGVLRPVLQAIFDAINAKDFQAWAKHVTQERLDTTPEKDWQNDYESSRDGSILVYRIEASGDGTAKVLMRFVSTQDPEKAPPTMPSKCIEWNVVWAFERSDGQWRLSGGISGKTPNLAPCPGA
jgi:hypothetical protein